MVNFISISLLIIFVLWLNYEIAKNNKLSNKSKDEFWKKEAQANQTRKADISDLDYISVPIDRLPLELNTDPTINSYRDTILSLSNKKILDLNNFSNTDLKLKYGASNITPLSEYDNNYIVLVSTLNRWGERLYTNGYYQEALAVLEVALDCNTNIHKTFELLAKIYISQGSILKIDQLIDRIKAASIRDKEALLLKLQDYKALNKI